MGNSTISEGACDWSQAEKLKVEQLVESVGWRWVQLKATLLHPTVESWTTCLNALGLLVARVEHGN